MPVPTRLLPKGWTAAICRKTGTPYYFNINTDVVQWEVPMPPQPPTQTLAGSSNDHLTAVALPAAHPAFMVRSVSLQQAKDIRDAISRKQAEEQRVLAEEQARFHVEAQQAANTVVQALLDASSLACS